MTDVSVSNNAIRFVNLLTPGGFAEARAWLAPSCEYHYKDGVLRGADIISSFEKNHEAAHETFDDVRYLEAQAERVEGFTVHVVVKDEVTVKKKTHVYTDRLLVTVNGKTSEGSIERIEHAPIEGEREKLLAFLKSHGVDWQ